MVLNKAAGPLRRLKINQIKWWKFCQEIRAFSSVQISDWKGPDNTDDVEAQYSTSQVSDSLGQFIKGGRWHLLSMNMHGPTKHWLATPVHEYGRPYKEQTGTSCLTIWKASQITWPTCTKKASCLTKTLYRKKRHNILFGWRQLTQL
jgi:hypothetical protein